MLQLKQLIELRKQKKSFKLEPMNPYERRIIHSALQEDAFVNTYSEGEEPFRRVVVELKKD
ncbi:putative RNA-binding protein Jag [Clostridium beijerinckii]|nr:putative RNA-binding protein Jag [Clostridium beijerinckii]